MEKGGAVAATNAGGDWRGKEAKATNGKGKGKEGNYFILFEELLLIGVIYCSFAANENY